MLAKPMTINERMMYATVRVEGRRATGEGAGGTGFFLAHPSPAGDKVRMLVSSRRAVRGLAEGTLHLHRPRAVTDSGRVVSTGSVPVPVPDFGGRWVPHPDPAVDLCALPYADIHAAVRAAGGGVYATFFETQQVIPPDEALAGVDAAEEVQMLGCPDGVWDRAESFPVFRRGTIATHPRADFRGRPEVLVDIACSDGCSGSPVVILTRASFKEAEADVWPVILFGVLLSRYSHPAAAGGDLVSRPDDRPAGPGFMHLGVLVKARELLRLAGAVAAADPGPHDLAGAEAS